MSAQELEKNKKIYKFIFYNFLFYQAKNALVALEVPAFTGF